MAPNDSQNREQQRMKPLVSIIIPCRKIDAYVRECVEYCKKMDYPNFENIVLPDNEAEGMDGARVISTGPLTPGAKRNIGVQNCRGEVCAFIDSDAYPAPDWLSNAIRHLDCTGAGAVGGPGLTPEQNSLMQKASGHVLSSLMAGRMSSRYGARKGSVEADDIHSCNFIAPRSVLEKAGNWNEKYWPGEDTLMCLAIRQSGEKLIEASDVVVYHHRRPLFLPHLRQVSAFGLHRGFFAKRFRGNSLKATYFAPSLLVVLLVSGILLSFVDSFFIFAFSLAVLLYFGLALAMALLEVRDFRLILPVWFGIIATHITYGMSFVAGLMKEDLKI